MREKGKKNEQEAVLGGWRVGGVGYDCRSLPVESTEVENMTLMMCI